ncbi:MAG: serine protease [Cyanobacteria bacterium J06631_2]
MFLSGDGDRLKSTIASVSPQKLAKRVNQVAADISIRILNQDFLGSGFIVQQTDREYIVITNQHVLRAGKAPYRIETVDGQTHTAEVITDMNTANYQYDLAALKFTADEPYQTATIGSSFNLKVGQPVFAAGFPYQESTSARTPAIFAEPNLYSSRKLALKPGRVAIILNQPLEEGYQIGYTNNVKKGMSGGALLNEQGEVIGVNGKHAYPLWESPEIYQDGSEPCPALQELITRSSLAIPIEKSSELATQLKSIKSTDKIKRFNSTPSEDSALVSRMQAIAESTERKCRQQPAILEDQ